MDLFLINRHGGDSQNAEIDEKANIDRVLKRIEKNKLKRSKKREREKEEFKQRKRDTRARKSARAHRKDQISQIIPLGSTKNDEFIDKDTFRDIHVGEGQPEESTNEKSNHKVRLDVSNLKGFTVLGGDGFDKRNKVKWVLPKWLSNPTVISVNLQDLRKKVSTMKQLDKGLRKKLKANGIKYFFPVQAEVIPWLIRDHRHMNLMRPRDVCVSAPTGSGKTLAFVLPVVQALSSYHIKRIRALAILPTQDLALQVFRAFQKYAEGTRIDVCLVTGKNPFATEQKQLVIKSETFGYLSRTDILVCTPGRLVDHLKESKGIDLQNLQYLIIDEADRVLDYIQNDWLYHLEKHLCQNESNAQGAKILNLFTHKAKHQPQKLLFSATLSQDPEKLQKLSLFQPRLFTSIIETVNNSVSEESNMQVSTDTFIGKYTTPKELTEKYILCTVDLKPLVLYQFINQERLTKTMIFTHTVETAHRLAILLQALFKNDLIIEEVSSQLKAGQIHTLIDNFSKGNIDVIVCTDKLARGMDFVGVQCVISYSPPRYIKTYIHRAGRTARAGNLGLAVTLLDKAQLNMFSSLLQQAGKNSLDEIKIPEEALEQLSSQYKIALADLKTAVVNEEEEHFRKKKSAKGLRSNRKYDSAEHRKAVRIAKWQNKKRKSSKTKVRLK